MQKLSLLLFLSLMLPMLVSAEIYKFYDEQGNVVYADQPGPNAEIIKQESIQTIKRSQPTLKLSNPTKNQSDPSYQELSIASPKNETTINDDSNQLNVKIKIKLIPKLKNKLEHKIVLLLNGSPTSKPSTDTAFTLNDLKRGQHTISAKVVDASGNTLIAAEPINIYLKRFSLVDREDSETSVKRATMAPRAKMAPRTP